MWQNVYNNSLLGFNSVFVCERELHSARDTNLMLWILSSTSPGVRFIGKGKKFLKCYIIRLKLNEF